MAIKSHEKFLNETKNDVPKQEIKLEIIDNFDNDINLNGVEFLEDDLQEYEIIKSHITQDSFNEVDDDIENESQDEISEEKYEIIKLEKLPVQTNNQKVDVKQEKDDVIKDFDEKECPECKQIFPTIRKFKRHWTEHHSTPITVYECGECGQKLHSQEGYDGHMRVHKGLPAFRSVFIYYLYCF